MQTEIFANPEAVAKRAASLIAGYAREAVAARGTFTFAVSGGHAPWIMLRDLASEDVPWDKVQVFQIDERVASAGDPDRNLTHLHESLLKHAPLDPEQIHAMPVELPDLEAAAAHYAQTLRAFCGSPAVLEIGRAHV